MHLRRVLHIFERLEGVVVIVVVRCLFKQVLGRRFLFDVVVQLPFEPVAEVDEQTLEALILSEMPPGTYTAEMPFAQGAPQPLQPFCKGTCCKLQSSADGAECRPQMDDALHCFLGQPHSTFRRVAPHPHQAPPCGFGCHHRPLPQLTSCSHRSLAQFAEFFLGVVVVPESLQTLDATARRVNQPQQTLAHQFEQQLQPTQQQSPQPLQHTQQQEQQQSGNLGQHLTGRLAFVTVFHVAFFVHHAQKLLQI